MGLPTAEGRGGRSHYFWPLASGLRAAQTGVFSWLEATAKEALDSVRLHTWLSDTSLHDIISCRYCSVVDYSYTCCSNNYSIPAFLLDFQSEVDVLAKSPNPHKVLRWKNGVRDEAGSFATNEWERLGSRSSMFGSGMAVFRHCCSSEAMQFLTASQAVVVCSTVYW